jgi:hypothetical protein
VVIFTLRPFYTWERTRVTVEVVAGWAPERVSTFWEMRKFFDRDSIKNFRFMVPCISDDNNE